MALLWQVIKVGLAIIALLLNKKRITMKTLPSSLLLIIGVVTSISSCAQKKEKSNVANDTSIVTKVVSYNFLSYVENISADTSGSIEMEMNYSKLARRESNPYGEAKIYLIHKNGGKWWYKQAKQKYPESIVPERREAKYLLKSATASLKDYNKWVFFTEKKYLSPGLIEDSDFDRNDPENKKPKWQPYYIADSAKFWVEILYEQRHDSKVWTPIASRTIQMENGIQKITPNNAIWGEDFVKLKLKELDENFKSNTKE